jgi:putative transposase
MKHKSYDFRLYPTKEQEVLLSKHFGHNRFVYNYFLRMRSDFYLQNKNAGKKSLNYYDCANKLTELKKSEDTIWLKEVNSQTLQQTLRQLDKAYNSFFQKKSKFPVYKKKTKKNSFTVPQHIKLEDGKLFIPKFKEGIKINVHRELEGDIAFVTIKKTPTGKYSCSVTCEFDIKELPKTNYEIGIDLGLKEYAILSDGTKYDNHRYFVKSQTSLAFQQRQLAKTKNKDSRTYRSRKLKVARVHEKISSQRKDTLHKISMDIIKNHDVICLEDLNVKGMIQNHKLAKHIQDASWSKFVSMLQYKAEWYGRELILIDRFFPSSKTCSGCGWQKTDLKLSDREWMCEECGVVHDRDVNASINILKQGLNIKSGSGTESDYKQKLMESLSLDKAGKSEAHRSLADG